MKNHVKVYTSFFGYGEQSFMPCEFCWQENEINGRFIGRASEVHHSEPRGMGGSKTKDYIANLIGTCREHHNRCEDGTITKEKQREVHLNFILQHVDTPELNKAKREAFEDAVNGLRQ